MTSDDIRGVTRLTDVDLASWEGFLDHETDIPASAPATPLPLSAGITNQRAVLTIPSFTNSGETALVVGSLEVFASLPGHRRGVHMSRMVEACDEVNGRSWSSLTDYLNAVTESVATRQQLDGARVRLRAETSVRRETPVTKRPSSDVFRVAAHSTIDREGIDHQIGLGADIMTACPCTQAFTRYSTIARLVSSLGVDEANEFGFANPTFTHSQRGRLWLHCGTTDSGVGLEHLYASIDAAAHLTFELLKRPDEHALVRRAHQSPQFTEDVVRDVTAHFVSKNAATLRPQARVEVTCRNVESIHGHDAYSQVSMTVAGIAAALGI